MDVEKWKVIDGFDGRYEVSNHGCVRYLGIHIKFQATTVKGYKEVRIKYEGKKYILKVHRLVASRFLVGNGDDVHHINGDKSDNRSCNLEWIDHAEHTKKLGGFNHYKNRLHPGDDKIIKELFQSGKRQSEIAKIFNIDASVISRVLSNKVKYLTV